MNLSLDPTLLALAGHSVRLAVQDRLEKTAIVPAGDPAAAGMDPAAMGGAPPGGAPPGGAPPPGDPAAAGGAPPAAGMDPAIQAQVQQAVQQQAMAGGKPGAGGGKKLEQQVMDTKLWTIQYMLAMIADSLGIKLPPSLIVGPPPDPASMQMAQADSQTMQGAAGPMGGGAPPEAAAAGGAPPEGGGGPIEPPQPVEAATPAPPGAKAAADNRDVFAVGTPFDVDAFIATAEKHAADTARGPSPLAARARELTRMAAAAGGHAA